VRQNVAITNAESAGVEDGADEVSMYMAAGEPWIWGKFRSDRPFQKGDMVCTEFNARFRGYYGQVGRTFVVGKATDVQRRSYETAVQAYRAMAGKLKPGVTAGELFDAGDTVVTGAGYQSQKLRSGHGMGLTYGEGFDIDHGDRTVMQTGHYVMFHVMAAVSDQGPYSFAGNAMIVTSGGAEELNQAAFSLETE
jgi:Xaa-Pro aminopeptidase